MVKRLGAGLIVILLGLLAACGGGDGDAFQQPDQDTSDNPVSQITLTTGATSLVANGVDETAVRVQVNDAEGNPLANREVNFGTTAGTLVPANAPTATATTNESGVAEVRLRASTNTGTATVTAETAGFAQTADITFIAGPTAEMLLVGPASIVEGSAFTVSAAILDANDNRIDGRITILVRLNGEVIDSTENETTDGVLNTEFNSPVVGAPVNLEVVAEAVNGVSQTITIAQVPVGSEPLTDLQLFVADAALPADGGSTTVVEALAIDAGGFGAVNREVTFTTTLGVFGASGSSQAVLTTNASGVAGTELIAPTTTGTAQIRVTTEGFSASGTVDFLPGAPTAPAFVSAPQAVQVEGVANLTVRVTDANNNPVPGETVLFQLVQNDSGGAITGEGGLVTNQNGEATIQYTAGANGGPDISDVISARLASNSALIQSTEIAVLFSEQEANSLQIQVLAAQLPADGVSDTLVLVTALDAVGEAAVGREVGLTTTLGTFAGSGTQAITGVTNANGVFEATLVAGQNPGTAQIQATADGLDVSAQLQLVAARPNEIQFNETFPASVDINTPVNVTVTVVDQEGNPVSGETVIFRLNQNQSDGTITGTTGVATDLNGQASASYTSGPLGSAGDLTRVDIIAARLQSDSALEATRTVQVNQPPIADRNVELLISSPQLNSAGTNSVDLTALVRDENNVLASGIDVQFEATSGAILVGNGASDQNGRALATLTTGGDPSNRVIEVTARLAEDATAQSTRSVSVVGTTLDVSGNTSLVLDEPVQLEVVVNNSAGVGIPEQAVTVSIDPGADGSTDVVVEPQSVVTDFTGRGVFTVTGVNGGSDTLQFDAASVQSGEALGTSATTVINVNDVVFAIDAIVAGPQTLENQIELNTPQTITLRWLDGEVPVAGERVQFSTTRGAVSGGDNGGGEDLTDADGIASVVVESSTAGPAALTARAETVDGLEVSTGPETTLNVNFVAIDPSLLFLSANPTSVGVNGEQSTIRAQVLDSNGNPVANQRVVFTLQDPSGGSLSLGADVTDTLGQAQTIYTSSALSSEENGVQINAFVDSEPTVEDDLAITVSKRDLFVRFGTGNELIVPSLTVYQQPYSAFVTDVLGNAVVNAEVEFAVVPTGYQKGFYIRVFDEGGEFERWDPVITAECPSEDLNQDGILNFGEDEQNCPGDDPTCVNNPFGNGNGILEPGNVANVPATLFTNEEGIAEFNISYPKDRATWTDVRLEARAPAVTGTEVLDQRLFTLEIVAEDVTDEEVPPPGAVSPFGSSSNCECSVQDELNNVPGCASLALFVIPESESIVLSAGQIDSFQVFLQDAFNRGVAGNEVTATVLDDTVVDVSPSTLVTGPTGAVTFQIEGLAAGQTTIRFSAATQSVEVPVQVF